MKQVASRICLASSITLSYLATISPATAQITQILPSQLILGLHRDARFVGLTGEQFRGRSTECRHLW
jgi:hypothetical protein